MDLLAHLVERDSGSSQRSRRRRAHSSQGCVVLRRLDHGRGAARHRAIAIPIVYSGKADVLALPAFLQFGELVGLAIFAVIGWIPCIGSAVKGAVTSSS